MIRHGFPEYLECSSKGDGRFSAFSARIRGRGNRSIETIYQAAKVFEDGSTGLSWKDAKGRQAINQSEVGVLYGRLWREYIQENPDLLIDLLAAPGLSDMFGQPGSACQATELWRIRVDHMLAEITSLTGGSIRVTNKRPGVGPKPDEGDAVIAVDRTNPVLGNPFVLHDVADQKARYKVIDQYSQKLRDDLFSEGPMSAEVFEITDRLLSGESLACDCWCAPCACHGDVIMAVAIDRAWRIMHGMELGYHPKTTRKP